MSDNEDNQFPIVSVGVIGGTQIQTVDARELHAFLEVGKDFSTWIKDRIAQYGFVEGQDFCILGAEDFAPQSGGAKRGGHNRTEYHISLDMGKELGMVERNEKGKEVRQYFIRMEKRARQAPVMIDLDDPAQLRPLLSNYAQRTQIAEAKVAELSPKAEAFERMEASEGSINVRDTAKMFDVQEKKLIRWFLTHAWSFRTNGVGRLQAYADKRQMGYLAHEPRTFWDRSREENRTEAHMVVTPKGLAKLAAIFAKEGKPA